MADNASTTHPTGYINADGLRRKYGLDEATSGKGGTYNVFGPVHVAEIDVSYTDFVGASDDTHLNILDYDIVIPAGCIVEKVEFVVGTAWDSVSNDVALNFGLIQRSNFDTIVDADGLVNTAAKTTIDAAGNYLTFIPEGTSVGALVGVQAGVGHDSVVCCYWGNHVPSQGTGKLRIFFRGVGA